MNPSWPLACIRSVGCVSPDMGKGPLASSLVTAGAFVNVALAQFRTLRHAAPHARRTAPQRCTAEPAVCL